MVHCTTVVYQRGFGLLIRLTFFHFFQLVILYDFYWKQLLEETFDGNVADKLHFLCN